MGFLDRAKAALGIGTNAKDASAPSKRKGERPALKDLPPASPSASIDDALVARDAGNLDEARAILRTIDRGKGLRTVLRAAAALEAGDEEDLAPLLEAIAANEPPWRLALQIASASSDAGERTRLVDFAREHGAPEWALAWTRASDPDDRTRTTGMVDLLFADAALARTVAAREWSVEGAAVDHEGLERYAQFSHGRDAIRRFGATAVARMFSRVAAKGPTATASGPTGGAR